MPAVYLCNVIGTGARSDPFRPAVFDVAQGITHVLMIDDGPRAKACVWSRDVTVVGDGIIRINAAETKALLIETMKTTNIAIRARVSINNWLVDSGYIQLPGVAISQFNAILFICRQVNAATDMSGAIE